MPPRPTPVPAPAPAPVPASAAGPTPDAPTDAPTQTAPDLRLFVAVDPGAEVRDGLQAAVTRWLPLDASAGLRWTRPEGRHLTLRYLGRTPVARLPAVQAACADAVRGAAPFVVRLGGPDALGAFPDLQRGRVLFVGVGDGQDALTALAARLGPPLDALGYTQEARPFTPHVTLARAKRPRDFTALKDAFVYPGQAFELTSITLYRSDSFPDGPRYTPVTVFPFG